MFRIYIQFFRCRSFNTASGLTNFARWAMEIIEFEPSVSADGRAVIFQLSTRGRDLECAVTREATEQHFWLQRDAGEDRVLKTFADGRKRITAVAEKTAGASGRKSAADDQRFCLPRLTRSRCSSCKRPCSKVSERR